MRKAPDHRNATTARGPSPAEAKRARLARLLKAKAAAPRAARRSASIACFEAQAGAVARRPRLDSFGRLGP